jgi:hypothetical protein
MSNEPPNPDKRKESPFSHPTVVAALIGGVLTLIAALVSALPQLIEITSKPSETAPAFSTATAAFVTESATQLQPAPTGIIPSAPTPIDPGISCLDRWQVVSSDLSLAATTSQGDCAQAGAPALGILASKSGISFANNNFRGQGVFGIATSIPADATVNLQVNLTALTQGEFWIAISDTPNPQGNMTILAIQPRTGVVRVYNGQTNHFNSEHNLVELVTNTQLEPALPFNYKIKFDANGNQVKPYIYFTRLPDQIVNLPKYLFLGYRNTTASGSMGVQANISSLAIEAK